MTGFIPLEKQSKRAKRAYHAQKRGSWNGVNPVTLSVESRKRYDRQQSKNETRRERDALRVVLFV